MTKSKQTEGEKTSKLSKILKDITQSNKTFKYKNFTTKQNIILIRNQPNSSQNRKEEMK